MAKEGSVHSSSPDLSVTLFFLPLSAPGAPGSCFIFHEGSFVVGKHFRLLVFFFPPKLEALFLPLVVIGVGMFSSLSQTVFVQQQLLCKGWGCAALFLTL